MGLNGFFPFLEKPFQVEKSILLILRKNVKIQSGQKGQSVSSGDLFVWDIKPSLKTVEDSCESLPQFSKSLLMILTTSQTLSI